MRNSRAEVKSILSVFRGRAILFAALITAIVAPRAWAQQASSGIAGVVRDSSGAVLPGATVEAASPALIEKVRTVVTDGEGRYNIVDLRPGAYVVTFTLTGFSTVRRDGVDLPSGFTATVNVELRVGALEETVTVSGAAPLVDSLNVRQQQRLSSDALDMLPTGTKAVASTFLALTPGLGGGGGTARGASAASVGLYGSSGSLFIGSFHGKSGGKDLFDGMSYLNVNSSIGGNSYVVSGNNIEEMVMVTGGASAESSVASFQTNVIPRQGGNDFRFIGFGLFVDDKFQADNVTDDLRARGATTPAKVLNAYDAQASVGGPIQRNKLWFFWTSRYTGNRNQYAGAWWNKVQGTGFYTPDLSRPADRKEWLWAHGGRLTWQASAKNKLSVFADTEHFISAGANSVLTTAPEASPGYDFHPLGLYQGTWTYPATNRLLIEAGVSWHRNAWPTEPVPVNHSQVRTTDISTLELSTNFRYNSGATYRPVSDSSREAQRFSVSYITGSHSFKVGFQAEEALENIQFIAYGDVNYSFLNGVPNSITQWATPWLQHERMMPDGALYAQDRWNIKRLTLNYGVRFDFFHGSVPAQSVDATQFIPARSLPALDCLPCWTDVSPRLGASYDLFGTGRTALKVTLGRYVAKNGTELAYNANPITTSVNTVTRTWTDNGNFVPDCDLKNFATNGECGPISNVNFGQNNPNATRYASDVTRGFGVRPYLWDISAEVQQELRPGVSVNAGYYRNWARNLATLYNPSTGGFVTTTNNLAVTPTDFDPYCITAPVDARLPNGGGYQVCGLYDVTPSKFGQITNLVERDLHYGDPEQRSDFFNFNWNAQLKSGLRVGGGVDTGRTVNDFCFVIDSPQQLVNCRVVVPFKAQTDVKINGSYPLPGDIVIASVIQSTSGPAIGADYAAPNDLIAPSLKRNLAACGTRVVCTATATVPLIKPQTMFESRRLQFDLRLTKIFRLGARGRLQANLDAYNILNSNAVLSTTSTYGARWQYPTQVLDGRLFQLTGQLTF